MRKLLDLLVILKTHSGFVVCSDFIWVSFVFNVPGGERNLKRFSISWEVALLLLHLWESIVTQSVVIHLASSAAQEKLPIQTQSPASDINADQVFGTSQVTTEGDGRGEETRAYFCLEPMTDSSLRFGSRFTWGRVRDLWVRKPHIVSPAAVSDSPLFSHPNIGENLV